MSEDAKLVDVVREELRSGFKILAEQIGQTNAHLGDTNARLDNTNARLDKSIDETRSGFNMLAEQIGQTNARLDEFKEDVAVKLKGISSFLMESEKY